MKSIKKKLSSKSGASMLLALVFLLFCLLVGGSVLSAASANGSRAARQKEDQQAYLSQRSAAMLLADMLKSTDDAAMQLTIKNVVDNDVRTVTFMAHGKGPQSELQMMLYEQAISDYLAPLDRDKISESFVNFGEGYSYVSAEPKNGNLDVALQIGPDEVDTLSARYDASNEDEFIIDFALDIPSAVEGEKPDKQHSYVTLSMKRYKNSNEEKPVVVNGVTTTTTIIRWDDPVIEKGGA